MRRLVALFVLLLALPVPAARAAAVPASRVVVIGIPGLRWQDVTPTGTPALWQLASTAASGALSVKAGPAVSCAADGFLTLGAGARATGYDAPCGGPPRDLARTVTRNRRSRERAQVGALAEALGHAGLCTTGDGPLARLAGSGGGGSAGGGSGGGGSGGGGLGASCALVVRQTAPVAGNGAARRAAATAADTIVSRELRRADPLVLLLVVGLSEAPGDRVAHLHVGIASGPGFGHAGLTSASTGRAFYVQLVDVAPTVLRALRVPVPAAMTGQPWQEVPGAQGVAGLRDLDVRAVAQKAATVPFVVASLTAQLLLVGGLLLAHRRAAARFVALAGTAVPGASFLAGLVPWWRTGAPLPTLLLVCAVLSLATAAVATRLGRGRYGPVAVVCGLTVAVLVADLLTGARLQLTSVTGYSPLVAGRFAGIGNVAFGVYAAAGLLALGRLARGRLWPVLLGGFGLVVVDGAPPWGSDVGGVLALLPAVAVLALLVSGRRLSPLRVALAGLAAGALVCGLALVDHARPPDRRTHLGRFVDQVADGTAGDVLHRKATAVFGLLLHSPVTALLPLVVVVVVLVVRRPPGVLAEAFEDEPAYRDALVALGVAGALGFVLNDSGAAVPALALVVALPATAALVSSHRGEPGSA